VKGVNVANEVNGVNGERRKVEGKNINPICNIARNCVSRRLVSCFIAWGVRAAIIIQRTTHPGIDIPGYRALTPDGVR